MDLDAIDTVSDDDVVIVGGVNSSQSDKKLITSRLTAAITISLINKIIDESLGKLIEDRLEISDIEDISAGLLDSMIQD